jgi:hypothetical protein
MKNIGFFLFETIHNKTDVGSSRIRGKWLIKYWEEAEEVIYGKKYDVIVYQKAYLLEHAKNFKGIKILDMCDPDWIDNSSIREMIDYCDVVTVPTKIFADFIKQITDKPVVIIPDRQDLEYFKGQKVHKGKAKEVVWHGYSHNSYVLKQALPALIRLNLNISIISNEMIHLKDILDTQTGKSVSERWTKWELETFNENMVKSDICIMPPVYKPNDRFKSNNKLTTAWALGLPVATNSEELEKFMDPKERIKEAEEKLMIIKRDYDVRQSVQQMKDLIKEVERSKNAKTNS